MINIEFHPEGFVENLKYMGLGMLAIVFVIGAIILVTAGLNRATGSKVSTSTRRTICLVGIIAAIALLAVLFFTDGSCVNCRKEGTVELDGQSYCDEHAAEKITKDLQDSLKDVIMN